VRFLPVLADARLLPAEMDTTRAPRREPERDPRADRPRFDLTVFAVRIADAFQAERPRPVLGARRELGLRAEARLGRAVLPAGACPPVPRRVRARSSTVSRPTILLKLLLAPRAVRF